MNRQILTDLFGTRYCVHSFIDGQSPFAIKPIRFTDQVATEQFLRRLRTPHGYWQRLLTTATVPSGSRSDAESVSIKAIATALIRRQFRLYQVPKVDAHQHPPHKRALSGNDGITYRFEPTTVLLANHSPELKHFGSAQEVFTFIEHLAPSDKQLQDLLESTPNLPLPKGLQNTPRAVMIDILATALRDNLVIATIHRPLQKTIEGSQLEPTQPMATTKPVTLAPPPVPTWVEVKFLDDLGEPVANEPYIIMTSDGTEVSGTTDGAGVACLNDIPTGNCYVSFPDQDGKGIHS